jgi:hypothetical protein
MKLLSKTWFRVVISFFGAGMISEIIRIVSGESQLTHEENNMIFFVSGLVLFGGLTIIARQYEKHL